MKKTKKELGKPDRKTDNGRTQVVTWMVICAVVASGVLFTVFDYRTWRRAETDKFGQGWSDLDRPASPLTVAHRLTSLKMRIMLPVGWVVEEKSGMSVGEGGFTDRAIIGKYMKVSSAQAVGNLVDLVDLRSVQLKDTGVILKERAYIGGNKLDMTVLEWTEELSGGKSIVKQEVWGKWGDEVIKIETSVDEADWAGLKKTVWAIYENAEMIY